MGKWHHLIGEKKEHEWSKMAKGRLRMPSEFMTFCDETYVSIGDYGWSKWKSNKVNRTGRILRLNYVGNGTGNNDKRDGDYVDHRNLPSNYFAGASQCDEEHERRINFQRETNSIDTNTPNTRKIITGKATDRKTRSRTDQNPMVVLSFSIVGRKGTIRIDVPNQRTRNGPS